MDPAVHIVSDSFIRPGSTTISNCICIITCNGLILAGLIRPIIPLDPIVSIGCEPNGDGLTVPRSHIELKMNIKNYEVWKRSTILDIVVCWVTTVSLHPLAQLDPMFLLEPITPSSQLSYRAYLFHRAQSTYWGK